MKDMRWKDQTIAPVLYKAFGDDLIGEIATGRVAMAVHAPTGTADIREFGAKLEDFSFGPTPQNGGNAVFEALVSFCFAPNATPEQLKAAVTWGTYKQFDPRCRRVPAEGDEGRGLVRRPARRTPSACSSPTRRSAQELDEIQAKYATVSSAASAVYYEKTKSYTGFGFPLVDPATVNGYIGVGDGSGHDRQGRRHRRVAG